MENLGTHIHKNGSFKKSLVSFFDHRKSFVPVQIFTGSNTRWDRPKRNFKDEEETLEYVKKNNILLFIHSIYFINLARDPESDEKGKKGLINLALELELGTSIGSSGIVVHVGKYLDVSKETALENMKKSVNLLLKYVKDTPLLIETPAGQGTEMLTDIEDFIAFFDDFDERVGICVDTCHVFASGYDPLEYLERVVTTRKINLVHLNDSREHQGSCKDRHAVPGTGHIDNIHKCVKFCNDNQIPMVIE